MKFDTVVITLSSREEDNVGVQVEFFPPLPEDTSEVEEEQPILVLLDDIIDTIEQYDQDEEPFPPIH